MLDKLSMIAVYPRTAFALLGVALLVVLLWRPDLATAVGDKTPTAVRQTPTPIVEKQLELYRDVVQEVTRREIEYQKALQAASATLLDYQKAVKAAADAEKTQPTELGSAQAKILELVSAAGLAIAAIFFGFFGLLVASLPGLPETSEAEKQVKRLYWGIAHANAAGTVLSVGASLSALVSLAISSSCWAWSAIILGALAAALVTGITVYFEVKLWQRNWRVR